jgi:peroxiredoxin
VFVRNRNIWAVGLAAAAIGLCLSCSKSSSVSAATTAQQAHDARKPAPDFTLRDVGGSAVKLSDYRGKAVLLNFWATWCGPCAIEIPWFKEFEQQYKSRGFEVLGVSLDEDGWKVIKPYLSEHQINYRVVLGDDSVSQLYGGVESLPTTFIIDRTGKVAFVHVGLAGKNEYLNEIQSVIGAGQTAGPQTALLALPSALAIRSAK